MIDQINKATEVIKAGGVILYPTDTIWGLGCDPNNESAIKKIIDIKNRPDNKSFIILVNSERLLNRYVKEIPEVCFDLIDYANKPMTIIYPNGQALSPLLMPEDRSIGIRMVSDPFCSKLMDKIKCGLVSTSANISGQESPKSFKDISTEIIQAVDYVVDLPDTSANNKPSQIIKIGANSEVTIIRK